MCLYAYVYKYLSYNYTFTQARSQTVIKAGKGIQSISNNLLAIPYSILCISRTNTLRVMINPFRLLLF